MEVDRPTLHVDWRGRSNRSDGSLSIDWRALLSSLHIEWRDRGANCTAGNINVKCPWCHSDPSFHLAIAEAREAFYCWRDPNRHSGRSFIGLLMKLGQRREEAVRLLNYYRRGKGIQAEPEAPDKPLKLDGGWARFAPAQESKQLVDYLAKRGFTSPRALCEQFDLRYAPTGSWARRLLIPLHLDGAVVSWTGRDIARQPLLRYKMQELAGYEPFYSPDIRKPKIEMLIVCEGPMDALKVASACHGHPVSTIALCGKALGAQKMLQIRKAAGHCRYCLVAMDAEVPISQVYHIIRELDGAIGARYIGRAKLPPGVSDPGELSPEGVIPWINQTLSTMSRGSVAEKIHRRQFLYLE